MAAPSREQTSCNARSSDLRLAEDPVDSGATHRALALGHVHTGLRHLDGPGEIALFLALNAVPVVGLGLVGHDALLVLFAGFAPANARARHKSAAVGAFSAVTRVTAGPRTLPTCGRFHVSGPDHHQGRGSAGSAMRHLTPTSLHVGLRRISQIRSGHADRALLRGGSRHLRPIRARDPLTFAVRSSGAHRHHVPAKFFPDDTASTSTFPA